MLHSRRSGTWLRVPKKQRHASRRPPEAERQTIPVNDSRFLHHVRFASPRAVFRQLRCGNCLMRRSGKMRLLWRLQSLPGRFSGPLAVAHPRSFEDGSVGEGRQPRSF